MNKCTIPILFFFSLSPLIIYNITNSVVLILTTAYQSLTTQSCILKQQFGTFKHVIHKADSTPSSLMKTSKAKNNICTDSDFLCCCCPGVFPNFLFHTSYWGIIKLLSHVSGTPNGSSGLFAAEPALAEQGARIRGSVRREQFTCLHCSFMEYAERTLSFSSSRSHPHIGEANPAGRQTDATVVNIFWPWDQLLRLVGGADKPHRMVQTGLSSSAKPEEALCYRWTNRQRKKKTTWRLILISSLTGRNTPSCSLVSGGMFVCPLKLKQRGQSRKTRSGPAGV